MATGPALAAAICISLYSSCQWAPDRTQVEADIDLHQPGKPQSLCTQWTLTEHVPPNHLHKPQKEVVAGQRKQSVNQLSGWVKSLPRSADNQHLSTRGGSTQAPWREHFKYTAWEIEEAVPTDPTEHLLY